MTTIISDWLDENPNKKMDKIVKAKIKASEFKRKKIEDYCSYNKIKLVNFTNKGFTASYNIDLKAGMQGDTVSIKKIGIKTIIREYIYYLDGDIVIGKILNKTCETPN